MTFVLNRKNVIQGLKEHTFRDATALVVLLLLIIFPIYKFRFFYKYTDGAATNIISGTAFTIGDKDISLFEIRIKEGLCDNNRDCSIEAQNELHKLLKNATVSCKWLERDRDNRFKSKCYIGDLSVSDQLVKIGVAEYK